MISPSRLSAHLIAPAGCAGQGNGDVAESHLILPIATGDLALTFDLAESLSWGGLVTFDLAAPTWRPPIKPGLQTHAE